MPQKRNPVASRIALACARLGRAHASVLGAGPHEHERAIGAWQRVRRWARSRSPARRPGGGRVRGWRSTSSACGRISTRAGPCRRRAGCVRAGSPPGRSELTRRSHAPADARSAKGDRGACRATRSMPFSIPIGLGSARRRRSRARRVRGVAMTLSHRLHGADGYRCSSCRTHWARARTGGATAPPRNACSRTIIRVTGMPVPVTLHRRSLAPSARALDDAARTSPARRLARRRSLALAPCAGASSVLSSPASRTRAAGQRERARWFDRRMEAIADGRRALVHAAVRR
jgi:hypothetical protein